MNFFYFVVLVFFTTHVFGEELSVSADDFKSEAAKKAIDAYQEKMSFLDKTLEQQEKTAKEKLHNSLRENLRLAAEEGDFEEVDRLSKFLQGPVPPLQNETPPTRETRRFEEVVAETKQVARALRLYASLEKILPKNHSLVRSIKNKTYIRRDDGGKTSTWTFLDNGRVARNGNVFGRWTLIDTQTILMELGESDNVEIWQISSDGRSAEVRYVGSGLRAPHKRTASLEQ